MAPTPAEPATGSDVALTVGAVTTSAGLVALGLGLYLDQVPLADDIDAYRDAVERDADNQEELRDEADKGQRRVAAVYTMGAVFTITGVALLTVGWLESEDAPEDGDASAVLPWIDPRGGAGVGWTTAW